MNVRRRLIGTLGAAVLAAPWRVLAQTPARRYRIGWLSYLGGDYSRNPTASPSCSGSANWVWWKART